MNKVTKKKHNFNTEETSNIFVARGNNCNKEKYIYKVKKQIVNCIKQT